VLVGDLQSLFFYFFFMNLSRSHVSGHGFNEFIRVDSSFFYVAFFLHLQHLSHLIMKLYDFI